MGSIFDKLNHLRELKAKLRQKLEERDVEVTDENTFQEYVDKVDDINTLKKFLDFRGVKNLFYELSSLTEIPEDVLRGYDLRDITDMAMMFYNSNLTTIPQLDTSNVTDMSSIFEHCSNLTTIPQLDTSNVKSMSYMFYRCLKLTDCRLKNIKISLQVGSGTTYGHLLTVDSLLFMIGELVNVNASRTFTIGGANLNKLASTYVKLIDITDEMRAEDALVDQKLPFKVCNKTDTGAYLVKDYVRLKKWALA